MLPQKAGYTYAVEPTAVNDLLANEEESMCGHSWIIDNVSVNHAGVQKGYSAPTETEEAVSALAADAW